MCVCVWVRARTHTLASELCVCVLVFTLTGDCLLNFLSEEVCPGRLDFSSGGILPSGAFSFFLEKKFEVCSIWFGFVLILGSNPRLGRPG